MTARTLAAIDTGGRSPVLLVHGLGGFKELWDAQIPRLASAGFRVLAVDLRGHGDSPSPATPWTVADFADDVLRFIDDLRIGRIAVVGHSLGGRTSFTFALAHPDRLAALVAVGAHSEAPREPYRSELLRVRAATVDGGLDAFRHAFAALGEIPERVGSDPAVAAWFWPHFDRNRPADVVAALDAVLAMPTLTPRLTEIRAPFLAVVGAEDRPFLELAARYATLIPNARTEVVPECGHYPMVDAATDFEAALLPFLINAREAHPW